MGDKDDDKVLTIAIPAYNSEKTLKTCLDSFLDFSTLDDIEILVVNDGSTDSTANIAQEYEEKYFQSFRLINKENGGHGSVINYAAKAAVGKYLKIIDSDDYVQTANLSDYIKSLKETDADVVLTHYRTHDSRSGAVREYCMKNIEFGRVYQFKNFWEQSSRDIAQVCSFHGITYRTDFYRSCNIHLSEGISYEDQEYATIPFSAVHTVLPLDLFLYEYSLGDPGQSVSDERQVKNLSQMETVLWKVIESDHKAASDYFLYKEREMLLSYYMAAMIKNPDKQGGRKLAKAMRDRVRGHSPNLHRLSWRQYVICVLMSYFGITGGTMVRMQKLRPYRVLTRFVH